MVATLPHPTDVLNSWKEIAVYLDRGIRTVQRWERDLDLPVHRIGKGKRSPVFAKTSELNFWLAAADSSHSRKPTHPEPAVTHETEATPIEDLRRLRMTLKNLSRTVAENSARQRIQAEAFKASLAAMRTRIKQA